MLRVHAALCLTFFAGCGETKTLELFPKPQPVMPASPSGEACGEELQCPPERPVCAEDACVQCVEDRDCKGAKGTCTNHTCVECRTDEQCPRDKVCFTEVGRCTEPCSEMADCGDKGRPRCAMDRGVCVPCLVAEDCKMDQVCDEREWRCVACAPPGNCDDAGSCADTRPPCSG